MVTEYLNSAGFETVGAANGQEALDILSRESVNIVISDIRMPVMSGIELLKSVKATTPDIPFIIMTGYYPSTSQKHIISSEADFYLVKPFSLNQLKDTIQKLLNQPA